MDRFNSSEEVNYFDNPIFLEGIKARRNGVAMQENPYSWSVSSSIIDTHKRNLWAAGWADEDMNLRVNEERK